MFATYLVLLVTCLFNTCKTPPSSVGIATYEISAITNNQGYAIDGFVWKKVSLKKNFNTKKITQHA